MELVSINSDFCIKNDDGLKFYDAHNFGITFFLLWRYYNSNNNNSSNKNKDFTSDW
jgi:hypothetical protein